MYERVTALIHSPPLIRHIALAVAAALFLSACDNQDEPAFTLQLLHAADMDSSVGALENVEDFSAILDAFRAEFPDNTLVVSSGDISQFDIEGALRFDNGLAIVPVTARRLVEIMEHSVGFEGAGGPGRAGRFPQVGGMVSASTPPIRLATGCGRWR